MSHRFNDEEEQQCTTQLTDVVDEISYQRFSVEVLEGDDAGSSVVSEGEELSIGSARGNGLVLHDRAASRHHCAITATAEGFLLRDLDSTNGTKLAGVRIQGAYLKSGAVFAVGRSKLRLESLNEHVTEALSSDQRFAAMLGRSAAMRRIFALLPRVAAAASTILLEGETGTGKTLLASAIHEASPRVAAPFVVVDCAAVASTLIESQLFGHAKGAFTGAHTRRVGAFVAASGGSVLLDEVGELPLELQPKLLRVLEERVVTPLGETASVPIDVRVIAATNRDLREEVNRGNFRADLFYRLNVIRLRVPPLRERPEDIEQLAGHFYQQCSPLDPAVPPELIAHFTRARWPGNVRELRSAVERAVLLGDADITPQSAASEGVGEGRVELSTPFRVAKEQAVARFERTYLAALFAAQDRNISRAARAARMDRNHLRELLRRHSIHE